MNTEMTQMAFMTAYGKAYLQGKAVSFEKHHPAAYHHRNIRFVRKEPPFEQLLIKDTIAKDPNSWFKYLAKEKAKNLYLVYQPLLVQETMDDKSYSSIKARNEWQLIVEKENTIEIWLLKVVAEQGDAMHYYYLAKELDKRPIKVTSLDTAKLFLKEILSDLIKFTSTKELANWKSVFEKASSYLSNGNLPELVDAELFPADCYGLEAKQIITAVDQAWVFGGMGSWSDVVHVNDYDLYQRLTANLYDTLCKSVASAINSYP
ncbi:MAG: hypothetical protein ACTSPK_04695 [Candidatus Heimdallarchaeota archaeon]